MPFDPLYNEPMHHYSRLIFSILLIVIGTVAAAFIVSSILASRIDRTQRELLLVQAKHASLLVSPQDIASLSGSAADIANPVYQRLKHQLTLFREANGDIRFVYVMGYRPEIRTQFFYVDSEPTTSADYSPPGQLFPDTREEDISRYLAGTPYTDGPYHDSWGRWVSGYVPMKNAQGAVVAMVGIDIATTVWHDQISFARTAVAIIAALIACIAIIIAAKFHRRQDSINDLSAKNQKLEKSAASMKELQSMARLGSMKMYFPEKGVILDEQFRSLAPADNTGKVPLSTLLSIVHGDDQEKFKEMIQEIETTDIVYAWTDVRLGSSRDGYRKYHIYGNIKRHASGGPERFDGIMQDITDIEK